MAFYIHQDELDPMPVTATRNGAPAALVGATNPRLVYTTPSGEVRDQALVAVDLATGQFRRDWVAGDTAEVGTYAGRVVVTLADGQTRTFPNTGASFYWFVTA